MKFDSEDVRMQHPQAQHIPFGPWFWYFNKELLPLQLELMQASLNHLEDDWIEKLDNKTLQLLSHDSKQATWLSVAYGHPDIQDDVLLRFAEHLGLSNGDVFSLAAVSGNVSLLDKIAENNPNDLKNFILTDNFTVFIRAVSNEQFEVMMRLMEHLRACAPEHEQAMIAAGGYYAFRIVAEYNQLSMMNDFIDRVAPEFLQEMIACMNYPAFVAAAGLGHLDVMNRLIECVAPEYLQAMIATDDYLAFQRAVEEEHDLVVNRLLSFPFMFAYAEIYGEEYGEYTDPFVRKRLEDLEERYASFKENNPQAVFDITDPEEAKLCFYMVRNLIRRHTRKEFDDETFSEYMVIFLGIPSVLALLPTEVTPNQPDELARFARKQRNILAMMLLDGIPKLHELIKVHDFDADAKEVTSAFDPCVEDKPEGQKKARYAMFQPAQPITSHSENDDDDEELESLEEEKKAM